MKNASAMDRGRLSLPLVKTRANRNSFQARMNEYMATATRDGLDWAGRSARAAWAVNSRLRLLLLD